MEIENETSKLIAIAITLVGIAFVITMAFGVFGVGKKMANSGQNDLVAQVDQVNTSVYTDLDQQTITGTRLKGIINQMAGQKCAILIATTPFLGNQRVESTLVGNIADETAKVPMIQVEPGKFKVTTSQKTVIENPIFVNYGAILMNSVKTIADPYVFTGSDFKGLNGAGAADATGAAVANGFVKDSVESYSKSCKNNQTIDFKDGTFTTKLEFATLNGRVQQFENKADLTNSGKTMSITDTAKFESYVLKDTAGNYMGLVFAQILK